MVVNPRNRSDASSLHIAQEIETNIAILHPGTILLIQNEYRMLHHILSNVPNSLNKKVQINKNNNQSKLVQLGILKQSGLMLFLKIIPF